MFLKVFDSLFIYIFKLSFSIFLNVLHIVYALGL